MRSARHYGRRPDGSRRGVSRDGPAAAVPADRASSPAERRPAIAPDTDTPDTDTPGRRARWGHAGHERSRPVIIGRCAGATTQGPDDAATDEPAERPGAGC